MKILFMLSLVITNLVFADQLESEPSTAPSPVATKQDTPIPEDLLKIRDPFKRPPIEKKALVPKNELENYPVESLKMVGALTGPQRVRAMVLAPDGKTFIVSEKMKIGTRNGTVKGITADTIYVREKVVNVIGQTENLDSEIRIQPEGKVVLNHNNSMGN
ncbi:MAG: pilus assembly protein PilP [Bdellovibrionota bacterium]